MTDRKPEWPARRDPRYIVATYIQCIHDEPCAREYWVVLSLKGPGGHSAQMPIRAEAVPELRRAGSKALFWMEIGRN